MPTFPESIIIVDNQGREKRERVESVVTDVAGETVFLTVEGLKYATDSLRGKSIWLNCSLASPQY